LLLTVPAEPHALPGGALPAPGGDNRISLRVDHLATRVDALRRRGARVRTPIRAGIGVDTVLLQDPAGNLVELVEPRGAYHERTTPTEEGPQ
jgi:catechol 2,3-dioxygenase-like lactoylglutathione lyase family enzyme